MDAVDSAAIRARPLQSIGGKQDDNNDQQGPLAIYISFNACANAPRFGPATRPDWVVSRNTRALPVEDDDALLKEAAGRVAA